MEKMTIEKAREIWRLNLVMTRRETPLGSFESDWEKTKKMERETLNEWPQIVYEAKGFIEGYESRDAEIEELKNIIKDLGAEDVLREKMK